MWTHIVNAVLGIWVMAAPAVLGFVGTPIETAHYIIGPIIVSFAVIAWWEETRPAGRVNVLTGLALVVVPFLIGAGMAATVNSVLVGSVVMVLAFRLSDYHPEKFGGGWSVLWQPDRLQQGSEHHTDTGSAARK